MEKQFLLKIEEEPKKKPNKGEKGKKEAHSDKPVRYQAERDAFVSCVVVFIFLGFLVTMLIVYLYGGY